MVSVKGKFLDEFPDIVAELDLSVHPNLDVSKIPAGSNTLLNWICVICKESYKRYPNHRTRDNTSCPKKECMLIKRSETNYKKFGWNAKYHIPERKPIVKREVPLPIEDDIEIWKDVPEVFNLRNKYEISSLGKLRNKTTNKLLSLKPNCDGYVKKTLRLNNNKLKSFYCHIIVAKTFIPNPDNKPTVNHINKIRNDNRLVNLEWATYSEQNLKIEGEIGTKRGKSIRQYDLKGNFIKQWDKATDVENEIGISRKNIQKVLTNQRRQSGGFVWKYTEYKDIEGEVWKEFIMDGYKDVLASSMGRVKIRKDINPTYGTLLRNGYCSTKLYNYNEKKRKSFLVHRIVCHAFFPNSENKPVVNHKDKNRSNNKTDNLEWNTHIENSKHRFDQSTSIPPKK